jgi:hypothetical protein
MAVGAVVARILTQYSDKGSKAAQKDIAKLQKRIDAFGKKALKNFALATAAAGAFAVKIGIDAVQGAAADEKAQTSLAIAIRNSTSATEEAIAANTKFLDQLELQVAVDNDELIPALQKLTTATGDLSQAQNLLILSTDVAVASGKDLGAVTTAISRAVQGNFTALTRLGLPIDKVAVEQKNLNKILSDFAELSKGQATAAANTYSGRLKVLGLAYNQVIDKLGYALMPLILEFVEYLTAPGGLLDALDEWIEKNETELQESLKGVSDVFKLILDNGDNVTKVLSGLVAISGFLNSSILGIVKWGEALILAFGTGYVFRFFKKNFGGVTKEVVQGGKRFDVVADKAKDLTDKTGKIGAGFDTAKTTKSVGVVRSLFGALSTRVKVVLGLMAAVGSGTLFSKIKDAFAGGNDQEILAAMQKQTKEDFIKEKARKEEEKNQQLLFNNELKLDLARDKAAAARAAAQAKRDALELKRQKLLEAQLKKIKNLGVKGTVDEEDPKQLNAAIALLERQKSINAIDKARLERMKEEVLLLKVRNDLATRYDDILKALADNKITTQEVQILALKWGVATEAVDAYLLQLKIIEDGTISDDEIISLAKSWGSTQAQAAQYLDFFVALNDGILSDAEIEKLKAKWKLTEDQVKMYADFVGIVNDGKLTDAEIIKIKDKWKLTTDQVVDYIKKIGAPVSYSGSLIDPARAAEIGWLSATAALERYLALLKAGTGVVTPPTTVTPPTVVTPPTTTVTPQGPCGSSRPYYNYYTGECVATAADIKPRGSTTTTDSTSSSSAASAIAAAVAKASGDAAGAAIAAAGVNPTTIASGESGAIGAASIAAQLRAAEEAVALASSLAAFKAKEAADLAAAQAAARAVDYDERFRFMGSSTMNNASSIVGSGTATSSPTINITVQGSVTSEQDLVQTVRNGLLNTQYNGNSLILQAI